MALPKPPKNYYRLDEIAEEWGWTVDNILDYAEHNKIMLSVNIRSKGETATILAPILYHSIRIIRNPDCESMIPIYVGISVSYGEESIEVISWREIKDLPFNFDYQESVTLEMLIITHQEKKRFEQECIVENTAIEMSTVNVDTQIISDDVIGPKERKTWLKIIYLLAAKLADSNKSAYLKADKSFNMSKFEDVLKNKAGDLLGTDDNINNFGHGLSNDNLKKIFDEAKTLF